MKKRALFSTAAAFGLATALAAPALAFPQHLHCLTLPNGNVVAVAGGVTSNDAHDTAFHNFHLNVHTGVPGTGPLTITPDTTAPFTCPPS